MHSEFFEFLLNHSRTSVLSWEAELNQITVELERRDMKQIEQKAIELDYERVRRNDSNKHTYPASITFEKT